VNTQEHRESTSIKVGIVGGGLAGLTCAYELSKAGIDAIVLEKDARAGGRIACDEFEGTPVHLGASNFNNTYRNLLRLLSELGLEDKIYQVPLSRMGIWCGGRFGRGTPLSILFSRIYSPLNLWKLNKLRRYISNLLLKLPPEAMRMEMMALHEISTADWAKREGYSPIVDTFIQPLVNMCFADVDTLAADQSIHLLAFGVLPVFALKGGMGIIADELEKMLPGKIITNAEVTNIEQKGTDEFVLTYSHKGKENRLNVNIVVLSAPTTVTNRLMPQIAAKWQYGDSHSFVVKGDLKYRDMEMFMCAIVKNPYHVTNVLTDTKTGIHHFYVEGEDYDFAPFFKNGNFTVLKEYFHKPCVGLSTPGSVFPNLTTELDNVYMCGDFYLFCCMEGSVTSARRVALMITKQRRIIPHRA
jgi:protoporphyrinogen oxidase